MHNLEDSEAMGAMILNLRPVEDATVPRRYRESVGKAQMFMSRSMLPVMNHSTSAKAKHTNMQG